MTKVARLLLTVTQLVFVFVGVAAVLLGGTPTAWASTVTLIRKPNIQNITPTSMVIVWTTAENVSSEVRYGIGNHALTAAATSYRMDTNASNPYRTYYVHEATLSGLTSNTDYQYQIYSDGVNLTPGGSITVRSGRDSHHDTFSFASLGDSGKGGDAQIAVAERLAQVDPDLILHAGDMNYETTYTTMETWFFDMYAENVDHAWFTPLVGNHDLQDGGAVVTNSFIVPPNGSSDPIEREMYYGFDYGNAHFTVLTSELSSNNGSDQYNFAAADLAATDQFWKVVVMHEPPYWGTVAQYSNLVDLFELHDVDIVISGDRHFYERLHPLKDGDITPFADGGIHYFVSGGGGTGLNSSIGSPGSWGSRVATRERLHHFVLFEVNGCEIEYKAIERTNSSDAYDPSDVFDSITIDKCPAGPPADLGVTKSDAADPLVIGDDITYTVQVTNHGTATAENVVATDTLPAGVTFGSAVPDQGSCSHDSGTITCNLGNMDNGDVVDITIVVTTTAAGTLMNNVTVTSDTNDDNSGNNSASEQTVVANTPPSNSELSITKSDSVDPIDVGDSITYSIAMTNDGPEAAKSVVVTDNLPAGIVFVSATPDQGNCSHDSGTITCDLGDVADDTTVNISIVGTSNAVGTLTNTVSVAGNVNDSDSSNDSDSETTTVEGSVVNAALNPIHDAHIVDGSGSNYNEATMRLRYGSSGSARIPYLKFDASSITGGVQSATLRLYVDEGSAGNTHSVYAVSNNYEDDSGPWVETALNGNNAPAISGDSLDTITSQVAGNWEEFDVTAAVSGGIVSFAITRAESGNHYYDSDEGANRPELVIVSYSGTPDSDMSVTMSDDTDPVMAGDNVTYTATVTNGGPDTAENVVFTNTLPGGVTYVSASPGCSESSGTVTCNLGSMINGATTDVDVVITTTADGTLSSNASVTSDNDDPNNGNNAALEQTMVNPVTAPDVDISPTSLGSGQVTDSQQTKAISIGNTGNADLNWSIMEDTTAVCASASDIAWASVSASSGVQAHSGSDTVDVTFDSTGLSDGTYTGDLCVQSDDPDEVMVHVPLTLEVCSEPVELTLESLTVTEDTNTITWTGSATGQIEVWWWGDEFYPTRGDCNEADNCDVVDKADTSFDHAVTDNSINYTYIVVADNICGPDMVSSANSNVKAEFDFEIKPGG